MLLFSIEEIKPLRYFQHMLLSAVSQTRQGPHAIVRPKTDSKAESMHVPKGVDLRLRTNGYSFAQGSWGIYKFCHLHLKSAITAHK